MVGPGRKTRGRPVARVDRGRPASRVRDAVPETAGPFRKKALPVRTPPREGGRVGSIPAPRILVPRRDVPCCTLTIAITT